MDAYELVKDKQIVIFELDNVLYPEKDYLLQVYYLFAQFIEYSEQKNAQAILAFMRGEFEQSGVEGLFVKTAKAFEIDAKYQYNFDLLHQNARLPLKLLLFKNLLEFMQELVIERKKIFIVTAGNPDQQLNKIKQTEWNGLENY
ncbi:MAG: haloacid dehalogenase, partial [Pedobacter sp.]